MLHLVTAIHGPEMCPAANKSAKEIALPGITALSHKATPDDITLIGSWASMPGHTLYAVVDAPSAHSVNEFFLEKGFGSYSTVNVIPVVDIDELNQRLGGT